MQQLELNKIPEETFLKPIKTYLRLGKLVELFVSHELRTHQNISILKENLQIQQEKLTLGEIDALLLIDNKPVHLEIVYKFYVYDATVGSSELEHWIGPNRKDSFIEKIMKLKNKQLPLLHLPETLPYLKKLDLNVNNIKQMVLFKAQLFVPYQSNSIDFKLLNKDCVAGIFLKMKDLKQFVTCKFYIPNKSDWLQKPNPQVTWIDYHVFNIELLPLSKNKIAPLVWIKNPKGNLTKAFIVWWE